MAKISTQNLLKLGFIQDEDEADLYTLDIKEGLLIDFYSESEYFCLVHDNNISTQLNFKSIQEIKDFIKCFDHER
jgi:hypothetical protein